KIIRVILFDEEKKKLDSLYVNRKDCITIGETLDMDRYVVCIESETQKCEITSNENHKITLGNHSSEIDQFSSKFNSISPMIQTRHPIFRRRVGLCSPSGSIRNISQSPIRSSKLRTSALVANGTSSNMKKPGDAIAIIENSTIIMGDRNLNLTLNDDLEVSDDMKSKRQKIGSLSFVDGRFKKQKKGVFGLKPILKGLNFPSAA
ncbi:hypothetical protein HK096_009094, partial [Nowakowskiella sp. JEL0078]